MNKLIRFIGKNKPTILIMAGLGGFIGTAISAYRAADVVRYRMDAAWNIKASENPETYEDTELTRKEKAWVYVRSLWPTFTLGVASATLIILGNSDHLARRSAAVAALCVSESTLKDYQAEMIKELGEKKEREVRDRVAEKRMKDIPVNEKTVIISEGTNPWICDTATGCYFRMGYEKFRRVIAEANLELFKRDYLSVADLYEKLDVKLPPGEDWFYLGWNAKDGEIEYYTTSTVHEINNEVVPCMVIEYRFKPHYDFDKYG